MHRDSRQRHHRFALFGALVASAILGLGACSTGTQDPGTGVGSASIPAASTSSALPSAPPAPTAATTPAAATPVDPPAPAGTPDPGAGTAAPPPAGPLVLPAAQPVSLSIPAIDVASQLSSLGRNPNGTVEVPSLDDPNAGAGWFRDSPAPGSLGPSIILGHVDSREFGPGVFYDLRELRAGDTVEITRADGTVAVFAIDDVQTVPKATFPTVQVYGNIDHAGLRLITCGGSFDENARSYDDNVIAFASLVSSR